jgi:deoxyribodipyrimidine photo-lyase
MRAAPRIIDLNAFAFENLDPDFYTNLKGKSLSRDSLTSTA